MDITTKVILILIGVALTVYAIPHLIVWILVATFKRKVKDNNNA